MSRLTFSHAIVALAAAAAVLGVPARAGAASVLPDAPLRPPGAATLSCLLASADGSVVSWQDRRRTIRAGTLGEAAHAPTVGSAGDCPMAAVAADGSSALVGESVDGEGVQLALRPPRGPFSAFAPVALPVDALWPGSGLAVGGGIVAIGATRQEGDRAVPVLLVRAADGSVRALSLPGGTGHAKTADDLVGPLAALDAGGRGLVVWGATHDVGGRLLAARFDGTGALGPVQALAAAGVDRTFTDRSLSVGADGAAALAWVGGHRTTVLTGNTAAGFDLAGATSTPLDWVAAVAPDGAAVAVDADYDGERGRVRIATRAAGRPFASPRAYRAGDVGDQLPAVAVAHGRYFVAFAAEPTVGSTELGLLQAVSGRAGDRPGPALTVPIASAEVSEIAAALPPGGPPTLLTITQRSTDCVSCTSLHDRFAIDAFHVTSRAPQRPRGVTVHVAARQRLGHPQALRVRVTCPRRCAVRVAGSVTAEAAEFDTSRALRRGTTVLRVPYANGGGSARFRPLRRARRILVGVAVDDATGERRVRRTVVIRP